MRRCVPVLSFLPPRAHARTALRHSVHLLSLSRSLSFARRPLFRLSLSTGHRICPLLARSATRAFIRRYFLSPSPSLLFPSLALLPCPMPRTFVRIPVFLVPLIPRVRVSLSSHPFVSVCFRATFPSLTLLPLVSFLRNSFLFLLPLAYCSLFICSPRVFFSPSLLFAPPLHRENGGAPSGSLLSSSYAIRSRFSSLGKCVSAIFSLDVGLFRYATTFAFITNHYCSRVYRVNAAK